MKKQVCSSTCLILAFLFLLSAHVGVSALMCVPRGNLTGRKPPPGGCNGENQSQCCEEGRDYTTYRCSPPISTLTKATLTLNSFAAGGDGGSQSACDDRYHSDDELVVALSTGWYNHSGRCLKLINIYGNGRKVRAKVVDECDSTMGCDVEHDYQPPCDPDIVDASQGVWDALGVSGDNRGEMEIYWSDSDHASDLSINLLCVLGFMYLLYLFLD